MEPEPLRQPAPSATRLALSLALWIGGALALVYLRSSPGVPLPDWSEARLSNVELAHAAARLSLYVGALPETLGWDPAYLTRALREEAMRRYEVELAVPGPDPAEYAEAVAALCVLYHGRGYVAPVGDMLAEAVARRPGNQELFSALADAYLQQRLSPARASSVGTGVAGLPPWLQALVLADVYTKVQDPQRTRVALALALTESAHYARWAVAVAAIGAAVTLLSLPLAVVALVLALFARGRPQSHRPRARWRATDVAELLGLLLFASALVALGWSVAERYLPRSLGPLLRLAGHGLTYVLTIVPVALLALARARRRQGDWREALGLRPVAVTRHLVQGLMICGVMLPLAPILTAKVTSWLGDLPTWTATLGAAGGGSFGGGPVPRVWLLATFGVVAVFVAPVAEEVIFRGFVQSALRGRLVPVATYLASALLFAVLHLKFDPAAFAATLIMGLVLAVTYEKTRSLYPGIVVHALTNAYVIAVMLVQTL